MKEHFPKPRTRHYCDTAVGMKEAFDYTITSEVYGHFLAAFHDYSPLHVDEDYAKARGFREKVMHGSLLNGFVSHFIGMYFPGGSSLLLTSDMRFLNPCYLGDTIRMEVEVTQKMDVRNVVVLDATLWNTTRGQLAARGRLQVMIAEES